jgi:hypothetical protein
MPNKRYSIIGFNSHLLWVSSPIPGETARSPIAPHGTAGVVVPLALRQGARRWGVEGMPGKPLTRRHVGPHADNTLHRLPEDVFLAGDEAHIVPPTGAKGLNLAVADVQVLANALTEFYVSRRMDLLDQYSAVALERVWRAEYFSWCMISMLHRFDDDLFQYQLQLAQLKYIASSRAAATALAENYVGLPLKDGLSSALWRPGVADRPMLPRHAFESGPSS